MAEPNRIVIVGAGPVGIAAALALCALPGVSVTLLEQSDPDKVAASSEPDLRLYALSPGTVAFLRPLGLGVTLDSADTEAVIGMDIFAETDANDVRSSTSASPAAQLNLRSPTPLAFMLNHSHLVNALWQRVRQAGNISVEYPVSVQAIRWAADTEPGQLALSNGRHLCADLIIAADGSASLMRRLGHIDSHNKPYDCDALVATFQAERHHGNIARQWFGGGDIMAWLPTCGQQISLVWSVPISDSGRLQALSDDAFCAAVEQAGHATLGKLALVSNRAAFPLKQIMVKEPFRQGAVWIGDAAHTVHPLAGQGVNLGMADARNLVETIRQRSAFSKPGDLALLRRYHRTRCEDTASMAILTDNLQSLFRRDDRVAMWARTAGLQLLNQWPWAKASLISRATR